MVTQIKKRNGNIVNFDKQKIAIAISKANKETNEDGMTVAVNDLVSKVIERLEYIEGIITVECIQDVVEDVLLDSDYKQTARAYIIYRERQKQKRERDIFSKRVEMKPFEYPELYQYVEAIRHSYWVHTEFNYTSDIQDYFNNALPHEKSAVTRAMLAIAQVEVAVKTFWGDIYHRMPKYEIGAVGASFSESECYREGTEILTPNGWVDFRDINNGDLVAQYNHDNTIDFVPARNKLVKEFDGKLHKITKSYLEAHVTPNHNLVIYKNKDADKFDLIPSEQVKGTNSSWFLPQSARLNGKINKLSDRDRLRIAIQADGSKRYWRNKAGDRLERGTKSNKQTYEISLKKQRKINRFLDLVDKNKDVRLSEYNVSREGYRKFEVDMDRDYNYKSLDWVDLSDKSSEWCEEFIQELVEWDGCHIKGKKDGNMSFSTTDKKVADIVQAVATSAGYRASMTHYVDNRSDKFNDVYQMVFVENRERVTGTFSREEIDYKGKVYCVEVDSGAIITRYNGRTFIAGNCRHADAYSHLLEILGLNNEFEKIKDIPALKQRVDYLSKMVQYSKSEDDREYILSMILFSLFTEHVSLFSQFLVMMSFNKHRNLFKGLSNVIEATSKEEQIHGLFGIDVVNIIREEHPEWFDEDLKQEIYKACQEAYETEVKVIDWILGEGELEFMSSDVVKEFVKQRLNNSLVAVGYEELFDVDKELVDETKWFDDEVIGTKLTDFLHKRSVNYTKFSQSINGDTIFSPQSDLKNKGKNEVNQTIRLRMLEL